MKVNQPLKRLSPAGGSAQNSILIVFCRQITRVQLNLIPTAVVTDASGWIHIKAAKFGGSFSNHNRFATENLTSTYNVIRPDVYRLLRHVFRGASCWGHSFRFC